MQIPFSPPYINEDVINEVVDTLKSGWITTGPKTKSLEIEIAKFTNARDVICVNSATSALMLALKWFGVSRGDEVIIPSYTYCATALAVTHIGAKPIMIDVGKDFNIDISKIGSAITPKTKAIIPVDIGGYPADINGLTHLVTEKSDVFKPLTEIQKKLGRILILRDAAHSFGAIEKGNNIGSIADICVFSFHAVKNLTSAEGGAICLNLPNKFKDIYKQFSLLSLNGQTKDALSKSKSNNWKYDIVVPGFKANMPDVCASIALAQLRSYPNQLKKREKIFDYYLKKLSHYDWVICPQRLQYDNSSSCHLFMLRVKGIVEKQRDQIINEIGKRGVSVNVHFIPLPLLTIFKNEYDINSYPMAYDNYSREISLPIYPQLTIEQLDFVIDAVVDSVKLVIA